MTMEHLYIISSFSVSSGTLHVFVAFCFNVLSGNSCEDFLYREEPFGFAVKARVRKNEMVWDPSFKSVNSSLSSNGINVLATGIWEVTGGFFCFGIFGEWLGVCFF